MICFDLEHIKLISFLLEHGIWVNCNETALFRFGLPLEPINALWQAKLSLWWFLLNSRTILAAHDTFNCSGSCTPVDGCLRSMFPKWYSYSTWDYSGPVNAIDLESYRWLALGLEKRSSDWNSISSPLIRILLDMPSIWQRFKPLDWVSVEEGPIWNANLTQAVGIGKKWASEKKWIQELSRRNT